MQQTGPPPRSASPSRAAEQDFPAKRAGRLGPPHSSDQAPWPPSRESARGPVARATSASHAVTGPLSERAKHRLRLAAALLRSAGFRFELPRAGFYDAVVQAIDRLRPEHRQRLRADVDWVEAYDREEQRLSRLPGHVRPPRTDRKPP